MTQCRFFCLTHSLVCSADHAWSHLHSTDWPQTPCDSPASALQVRWLQVCITVHRSNLFQIFGGKINFVSISAIKYVIKEFLINRSCLKSMGRKRRPKRNWKIFSASCFKRPWGARIEVLTALWKEIWLVMNSYVKLLHRDAACMLKSIRDTRLKK